MDLLILLKALILGVVEGLTEFLPISSTGHLILAGQLLDFNDERGKLFEIVIQSGAIFAVVLEYRRRLVGAFMHARSDAQALRFLVNVAIAFVPLAVLGLVFGKQIKAHLFNAPVVASTFILGGLVILWAESRQKYTRVEAFALIPGTSRSGSTIIGGMLFGLSRKAATEFSFFLAIPTLFLASLYQLYKERHLLVADDAGMWAVGFIAAFASAYLCVRWLLRYIMTHDFRIFAWYRIAFGLLILLTWQMGWVAWVDH